MCIFYHQIRPEAGIKSSEVNFRCFETFQYQLGDVIRRRFAKGVIPNLFNSQVFSTSTELSAHLLHESNQIIF